MSRIARISLCSFLYAVLIANLCCVAEERAAARSSGARILRIGIGRSNPPYSFVDNGRASGFWVDLVEETAKTLGYEPEIRADVWGSVRDDLAAGKLDVVASMADTPERRASFDFSVPVSVMTYSIWVRYDSPVSSLAALEGKTVVIQRGSMMADRLASKSSSMDLVLVRDDADCLVLLDSGRYDAAILPLDLGYYFERELKLRNVRPVPGEICSVGNCFAVAGGDRKLALELDDGLKILKENGRYQAIYRKWLGVYEKPLSDRVVADLLIGLGTIAFFLLLALAFIVVLRRAVGQRTADLAANERRYRTLLESLPQMIFVKDRESKYLSCNERYASILGLRPDEILGKDDYDFYPRELADKYRADDRSVMESGSSVDLVEKWASPGGETWVNTLKSPIRNEKGEVSGVIGIFWDISDRIRLEEERERSLREKEILLQEVNHRVKNNLQLISAMLRLEADGSASAEVGKFVKDTISRIASISVIHEMLYIKDNVAEIRVAEYLGEIGRNLTEMYSRPDCAVRIDVDARELRLDLNRMVPLGLLTNEMITNSLKYAFPERDSGLISIAMAREEASGESPSGAEAHAAYVYRFKDDGVGLPPGFDAAKSKSLGLVFIQGLARQLGGELSIRSGRGLEYELRFPVA
jgi:polar amino acid transport system substrate-binding protein